MEVLGQISWKKNQNICKNFFLNMSLFFSLIIFNFNFFLSHRTEQAIPRQVNPTGLSTKTALIDSTEVETDVRIAQVESGRGFSISREMTVEESALLGKLNYFFFLFLL